MNPIVDPSQKLKDMLKVKPVERKVLLEVRRAETQSTDYVVTFYLEMGITEKGVPCFRVMQENKLAYPSGDEIVKQEVRKSFLSKNKIKSFIKNIEEERISKGWETVQINKDWNAEPF